jgi:hypothetical protein
MASALDRHDELTLMPGARPCPPPWLDLAAVSQKPAQHVRLLVINLKGLFLTENALFLSPSAHPTMAVALPPLRSTLSTSTCQR